MATLRRGAAGASIKFYEAAPAHDAGIAGNPLRTRPTSQRISAGYTSYLMKVSGAYSNRFERSLQWDLKSRLIIVNLL